MSEIKNIKWENLKHDLPRLLAFLAGTAAVLVLGGWALGGERGAWAGMMLWLVFILAPAAFAVVFVLMQPEGVHRYVHKMAELRKIEKKRRRGEKVEVGEILQYLPSDRELQAIAEARARARAKAEEVIGLIDWGIVALGVGAVAAVVVDAQMAVAGPGGWLGIWLVLTLAFAAAFFLLPFILDPIIKAASPAVARLRQVVVAALLPRWHLALASFAAVTVAYVAWCWSIHQVLGFMVSLQSAWFWAAALRYHDKIRQYWYLAVRGRGHAVGIGGGLWSLIREPEWQRAALRPWEREADLAVRALAAFAAAMALPVWCCVQVFCWLAEEKVLREREAELRRALGL